MHVFLYFRSPLKCSFTLDADDDTLDDSNVETFVVRKSDKGPSYVPVSLIEARYVRSRSCSQTNAQYQLSVLISYYYDNHTQTFTFFRIQLSQSTEPNLVLPGDLTMSPLTLTLSENASASTTLQLRVARRRAAHLAGSFATLRTEHFSLEPGEFQGR